MGKKKKYDIHDATRQALTPCRSPKGEGRVFEHAFSFTRISRPCVSRVRRSVGAARAAEALRPGRRSPRIHQEISFRPETVTWKSAEPSSRNVSRCVLCQLTSATFWATSLLKRTTTSRSRPFFGNHVPGVAEIAIDGEAARDLELVVQRLDLEDAAEVEGPLGPVQRRPAHHVPASPAEEQPVGAQPGRRFPSPP